MTHKARFVFETPYADKLYASLSPETGCYSGDKSVAQLLHDSGSVTLLVEAEDVSALRASLNMWLRLVNVANEVLEL
ncbi:MAG: KEOPS complex subunit Pcc1 [Methanocorpusculum sp.]|nr:KEOPS complex subunit Pcc1 [Methanocorpusculum sp.]